MILTKLRRDAESIFFAGVKAVDPSTAIMRHLTLQGEKLAVDGCTYDLTDYENVFIIGAGKASAAMARPIEKMLGERIKSGVVQVKYGHAVALKIVHVTEARHPVPDEAGLVGTREMTQILRQSGPKDLVICLISGGGSALLPSPAKGLTLEDIQNTTRLLLDSGATIHEINTMRKHVSQLKGGQITRLAYPSTLVSLILSDVIGDNLESIASGPTAPDSTTFSDCQHILDKYGLRPEIPVAVLEHLQEGIEGKIAETPKPGDAVFERTQNVIIGSNILAAKAAEHEARGLGYNSLILSTEIEGETKEVAKVHAAIAKEIIKTDHPVQKPACVISGGETTVTVRGKGLGGRNQEFALAVAIEIDGWKDVAFLSGGTDGTDGPTDAAGAFADGTTGERAKSLGFNPEDYLRDNDSYHFFRALGDLLITGPTYTNVMDLRLVMVG